MKYTVEYTDSPMQSPSVRSTFFVNIFCCIQLPSVQATGRQAGRQLSCSLSSSVSKKGQESGVGAHRGRNFLLLVTPDKMSVVCLTHTAPAFRSTALSGSMGGHDNTTQLMGSLALLVLIYIYTCKLSLGLSFWQEEGGKSSLGRKEAGRLICS